ENQGKPLPNRLKKPVGRGAEKRSIMAFDLSALSARNSDPALQALSDQALSVAAADMKGGALRVLDDQLAALYYGHSAVAAEMQPFTQMVDHFAGSISSDGQYVTIDATAKDG